MEHEYCDCCKDDPKLGLDPWMVIVIYRSNNDDRIGIFLFHRWDYPDTAYYVFGRLINLLGIRPRNPFLALIVGS